MANLETIGEAWHAGWQITARCEAGMRPQDCEKEARNNLA